MPEQILAGRYRVIREIARSNDIVYEAEDTQRNGTRVAVKELNIPSNLTGQALRERIERFHREARASSKLSHPNIVGVFGFGEDHGVYYIAMEYLEGQNLRDRLQVCGQLPQTEAVDIISQVLRGLAHAHSRKVIHRDIKPDNIQLLPAGLVKLTDFGIARLTEEASLTNEGQIFGTPSYMSPEQIEGRSLDYRTDLFSTAVVMYESLAGRKPFIGDSVVSITYAIMHAEPPPMNGVPYGLEQAILRGLSKDPNGRYSSADEMGSAIRNADSMPPGMFLTGQRGSPHRSGGYVRPYGQPQPLPPAPFGGGIPQPNQPLGGYANTGTGYGQPPSIYTGPPPAVSNQPPPQFAAHYGQAPMAPMAGPFANWTSQQGAPGMYGPPPSLPIGPSEPLFSEATLVFFRVFLGTMVLAAIIVGLVLMFSQAYDQQKKSGAATNAQLQLQQGLQAYNRGDFSGAAKVFEQVVRTAPDADIRHQADVDLAVALDELGVAAFTHGNRKLAETYLTNAAQADPNNVQVRNNLGALYDSMGDHDRAMQEWQAASDSSQASNGADGGSSAGGLQPQLQQAAQLLEQGNRLYREGNTDGARSVWASAVQAAPGSDAALQAQKNLDSLSQVPAN